MSYGPEVRSPCGCGEFLNGAWCSHVARVVAVAAQRGVIAAAPRWRSRHENRIDQSMAADRVLDAGVQCSRQESIAVPVHARRSPARWRARTPLRHCGAGAQEDNCVFELTYNWDRTEPYDLGKGYAQVAIGTDDVYKTAEAIRENGGTVSKEPVELPGIGTKIMATTDPGAAHAHRASVPGCCARPRVAVPWATPSAVSGASGPACVRQRRACCGETMLL